MLPVDGASPATAVPAGTRHPTERIANANANANARIHPTSVPLQSSSCSRIIPASRLPGMPAMPATLLGDWEVNAFAGIFEPEDGE
jgi:hypothetical protein